MNILEFKGEKLVFNGLNLGDFPEKNSPKGRKKLAQNGQVFTNLVTLSRTDKSTLD
jgi:hypothetical protein